MAKKTLIISQKQLDEIVGGNASYLDNVGEDFAENGNNEVFTAKINNNIAKKKPDKKDNSII